MAQCPHQPTLKTTRLKLVPLGDEHLPMQLALDSDPQVLRYLKARPRTDQEIRDNLIEQKRLAVDVPGMGYWVGIFDNEPVGWFFIERPPPPQQGQAELGYRLLRKFWRRGFGTEGSREVLRYSFETLGLERVFAQTMAVNAASKATMVKLGMRFSHTFQFDHADEELVEGWEAGEVEYAITREEWMDLAQSS